MIDKQTAENIAMKHLKPELKRSGIDLDNSETWHKYKFWPPTFIWHRIRGTAIQSNSNYWGTITGVSLDQEITKVIFESKKFKAAMDILHNSMNQSIETKKKIKQHKWKLENGNHINVACIRYPRGNITSHDSKTKTHLYWESHVDGNHFNEHHLHSQELSLVTLPSKILSFYNFF